MSVVHKSAGFSLAIAAAALMSGCSTMSSDSMEKASAAPATAQVGKCEGVNSCKGTSECATANSSCKGQNSCAGHGWISLTEKECTDKGGTFTAA